MQRMMGTDWDQYQNQNMRKSSVSLPSTARESADMSPNANLTSEGGHGQEEPSNGSIVDYEASDDEAGNAKGTKQNNVRKFIGVAKLKYTINNFKK